MRRRFRRYPPRAFWVCTLLFCAVAIRYWWGGAGAQIFHAAEGSALSANLVAGECEILSVERGDLITVRQQVPILGKEERQPLEAQVQLLGVTTEGEDAGTLVSGREFTASFLKSGRAWLELDRRRVDSRGHFLVYLYRGDTLLNEELLRAGLGEAQIYPGDNQAMHKTLVKAEKEARRASQGKWSLERP